MIQRLVVHAPCNPLSIGQVSFNILRELYRRKVQCTIFPYGQPDLSAYSIDPQFGQWIERSVNSRYEKVDRKVPTLAIWHIADSQFKPTDRQYLLSFHEVDAPTAAETNIVNQQDHTFFTSSWTVDAFKTYGANHISFVPLGLDEDFYPAARRTVRDDITHWICVGKFEEFRKLTAAKIQCWIKRYGGNRAHQLTLCVDNPFLRRETCGFTTEDLLAKLFAQCGGKPFNVTVLPHLKTNAEMRALYQSADVDLSGIARAEGWNLPAHTVTALGKWSIVTNCSAHKDWATAENSILVEPTGMVKAYDGVFFTGQGPFNVGNMYDFNEESIMAAMERAEKVAHTPNVEGAKLRTEQTYAKTVDTILAKIEADSV